MKKLLLTLTCLAVMAGAASAQTQSIKFVTSGSGSAGSTSGSANAGSQFSLDTYMTFTGFTADGLSYWLEVPTAIAPYLTITTNSYFTFTDGTNTGVPKTFTDASGADTGFLSDKTGSNAGDLGATAADSSFDVGPGTYLMTTVTFTLAGNAPAGTYAIKDTLNSPKGSAIFDSSFGTHSVAQNTYSLTVVPEPSTWSLIGLGGLGAVGMTMLRARKRRSA